MPTLFEPITIRDIELKNRIVVSPMCEYSSVDGFATDWHLVHLGSRAVGGAGLIITEAAAVSPEGRISYGDLGIWQDGHIEFLKRITSFIEEQGCVPGIQLAHAGRKASHHVPWQGNLALTADEGAWQTVAPSPLPHTLGEPLPKEMGTTDITKVRTDFIEATKRALKSGFKVFELHAAHGYLLNEFLSPISNQRTDAYGGSFENRIRLLVEITTDVRSIIGEALPLFVRISATDWVPGGWAEDDSVKLAKVLAANGVDLIDCSSGGNSPDQKIPVSPMYQVIFAKQIKKETGLLTGAVGLITKTSEAAEIIENQQADLVILARQFLRDPYFPLHAAAELGVDVTWPVQYERAKRQHV